LIDDSLCRSFSLLCDSYFVDVDVVDGWVDESGLVQRDLVYIEDGNQLKKDDGSINLDNLVLSGTTIRKALEFQSPTHSFETDMMVMYFLEHLPGTIMDEEQLYELSLEIVPAPAVASAPCSPASSRGSPGEEELVPYNLCNSPSTSNSIDRPVVGSKRQAPTHLLLGVL